MKVANEKLEKHKDKRGWLIEILHKDEIAEDIELIHYSVSKPGVVRGNHYHTRKTEWFCVAGGKALLLVEDINSGKRIEFALSGTEPRLVKIPPGFAHAIRNIGSSYMNLVVIVDEVFDSNDADTSSRTII